MLISGKNPKSFISVLEYNSHVKRFKSQFWIKKVNLNLPTLTAWSIRKSDFLTIYVENNSCENKEKNASPDMRSKIKAQHLLI